jgi:hypothetical protein
MPPSRVNAPNGKAARELVTADAGPDGIGLVGHSLGHSAPRSETYKWLALSNTTVGTMLATIDASIMLIAMPDIFRASSSTRWRPPTASTCCG